MTTTKTLCAWILATAGLGFSASTVHAEHNWPQWRGPNFDGSSEATNLPETIDKDKPAWVIDTPGFGNSSPVVFGERVFISCVDESSKLQCVCLSRTDGHILWQKDVGIEFRKNDQHNNGASPSAVTDGKTVYFYFSTGDLAAFDMEGKPLWQRNIQKDHGTFNILWIYSSSPLLYKGKLYIQVLQRNVPAIGLQGGTGGVDSYILAVDPETGKDIWKIIRPSDAVTESRESYATPIPLERDGHSEVMIVGGDCVTAHDADTGKEIWRAGGWNPQKIPHWRLVPSVTVDPKSGLIFACAPKDGPVMAIHDGGQGDVTATAFAWKSEPRSNGPTSGITSDVCVPLLYKSNLYVLNGDKKHLYCLDPATGKKKWNADLGGKAVFRASPSAAEDKIYCMNEIGDVSVLSADDGKVLSHTSLEGKPTRGTVALTDGMVVIRSGDKIYGFKK